ncbi:hypothetical protein ABPG72_011363 [Tetrahymena utriculariae]
MNSHIQFKGNSQQLVNPIVEAIKNFYINDLYQLVKQSKRNIHFSILQFCFYELIIVQMQLDNTSYNQLTSKNGIFSSFIGYFFYLKEFTNNSNNQHQQDYAVLAFFTLNCLILLFLFINLVFRERISKERFELVSQILQCYEYIISLPSLYISLSNYSFYLSFANIPITIFIGSLLVSLDYDYQFLEEDLLQKCDSHLNPTVFHLNLVLCISSCFFDIYVTIGCSFAINLLKLLINLRNHTYINKKACKWMIILSLMKIALIFPMLIYSLKGDQQQLLFLLSLVLFPLSYQLGNTLFLNWYSYICLDSVADEAQISSFSLLNNILDENNANKKIDIFCRLLVDNIKEKMKFSNQVKNSTFIFAQQIFYQEEEKENQEKEENYSLLRNLDKKKNEIIKTFSKLKEKEELVQNDSQNVEDTYNSKSLQVIIKIYNSALNIKKSKNAQLTELHFSYLTLLSTLNLNSCLSYTQILNIKSNTKLRLGWKDQQKMKNIMKLADIQSQLNQKRMKKGDEFQLYHILQFEEEMNKIQKQYFECMRQYKVAVEKLSMSFIDINEILILLKQYRDERGNLENKIKQQLQFNSHSESLKNLCINFDFYMLHNQSLLKFYEKQNRQSILQLKTKEYYSKQSCFIYVSLLEKSFGIIQKANRAFVQAFGFANKSQILEKSILQIFPNNFFRKSQESVLSKIINENFLSLYNQYFHLPLFIGKNSLGYAIPLQLKIQSQIVEQNDFGVTIWAKPIKDDNLYVLLDNKDHSMIKVASKIFYDEFMYDNFSLQFQRTLRMDSLIPVISDLIRVSKLEVGKKFETILIQPFDRVEAQTKPNIKDPNFLNHLKFQNIFSVTLHFQSSDSKLAQFVNMIIDNYEPIFYMKDKIQQIQSYQNQIKELCGISLQFDPSYEEDNFSDMRAKSYYFENSYQTRAVKQQIRKASNNTNINESTAENLTHSNIHIEQSHSSAKFKPNHYSAKDNIKETPEQNNTEKSIALNQENQLLYSMVKENPIENIHESNLINLQSSDRIELNDKVQNNHSNSNNNHQTFNQQQKLNQQLTKDESQLINFNDGQQSNEAVHHNKKYQAVKYDEITAIQEENQEFNSKYTFNVQEFKESNSKEHSTNHLLSSKHGLFTSAFKSKQQTIGTKKEQKKESDQEKSNLKESKNPFTQDGGSRRQKKQDLQSVSSSSKSVENKYLFEMIHTKRQISYLKVINFVGISSVLITLSLTLSGFFTFLFSLISQRENFKYINWIYMININLSYSLSERYLIELNRNNFLYTPNSLNDTFSQLLFTENYSRINKTKEQMILLYNNSNPDIQVFNIIQQNYLTQKIFQSLDQYQENNLNMIYSLLLQMGGIFYFISDLDPYRIIYKQNRINYPPINKQVSLVFDQLNTQYQSQLNSILNQSLIQLYVVLIVSLLFLASIIPSFIFTKMRQQKILELFATFDPATLKEILGQLTYQLSFYGGFDKNQTIGSKSNFSNMNQTHISKQAQAIVNVEKKLNISRTSVIQFSIKYLAFALVIIFGLIMIYPSVFYVTVRNFIDNSKIIYQFNNAVCKTYFTIVNTNRSRQGLLVAFLMPQDQAVTISQYQSSLEDISDTINTLPDMINQNLAQIDQSNLYNNQIYQDYLKNVYTGNACDTMQNFTKYQNSDFLYNQCNSVAKGSLQKGLLNAVLYFSSVLKDFLSFAFSYDLQSFQAGLKKYYANNSAYKQFQFKIELSKAHEYLMNFFQDQNLQLYNYYEKVAIVLVVFQVSFVILIFSISWYYYFGKINNIIFSTKQLLDIFPQTTLIQNTYIMSYLRKNE